MSLDKLTDSELKLIAEKLLKWFLKNKELHFFRLNRTPYITWISEVALQQTRLRAALPRLQTFLKAFPNIYILANSTEEEVVYEFRGLGYYNRARNLRKGAQYVVEFHNGELPQDHRELMKIPSIGSYTAAAIASICFGKNIGVIDGNVKRIFARLSMIEDEFYSKNFIQKIENLSERMLNLTIFPGDLNESLMEFGQKICTAQIPLCQECPILLHCRTENPESLPYKKKNDEKTLATWNLLIQKHENGIIFTQYKDFKFLKGHWGFPSFLQYSGKSIESETGVQSRLKNALHIGKFKHSITNFNLEMNVFFHETPVSQGNSPTMYEHPCNIEKKISASAIRKAWEVYKKHISPDQ